MKILARGERGAATVEFAIIATVLLAIVFGIIEFGILMLDKHILTNASREGARAGIVMTEGSRLSNDQIRAIVEDRAEHMVSFRAGTSLDFGDWPSEEPERWIEPFLVSERTGNIFGTTELVVTVKYEFHFLVLSGFGLGPITLTAKTEMMME